MKRHEVVENISARKLAVNRSAKIQPKKCG